MTCEQAIEYLYSRLKFGLIPGLERIQALCELVDNPQDKLKFIHVGGTNGKGSTCSMIAGMLQNAGYKTGLFTSPYVIDFRERIQINGQMIDPDELGSIVEEIIPLVAQLDSLGITPTEFEVLTVVSLLYYCRKKCDYVVLEVGLGGLCDSTNIIKQPEVCVITSVSYDHTHILGETIEEIAFQKSGIIKENTSVVVYPQIYKEAEDIIFNCAKNKNCKIYSVKKEDVTPILSDMTGSVFSYKDQRIKVSLIGSHQLYNAATAFEAGMALIERGVKLTVDNILFGIENAHIAARTQIVSQQPLTVIDGGHNPDGVAALCQNLVTVFSGKKVIAIVGMMADKDVALSAKLLAPLCERIVTVTVDNPRSMKSDDLKGVFESYNSDVIACDNLESALKEVNGKIKDDEMLLICGSLYLASEAENLKNQ
ncbi:MAG: bifunctional folylpolyglutamate synthase/dihydrofolate synthase [Clostridia bacterium]|nr:bifunctional folylpolyglutamate synthase/dihydrofolate synthase [Clostridia bacterium]